ncbi:MAG: oligosaccharide repeat unit polymerase [Hyphomicrobiales bacterium]|nr:MAG: oligosaccharide repeat unit polymerase [Hyphomicrobiales bacterium]
MNDYVWPVLSLLLGTVALGVVTKLRVGYLLSPFSVSIVMLMAIFGVRPILISQDPYHTFYGYSVSGGLNDAALIGFVGIVGLVSGYGVRSAPQHGPLQEIVVAGEPSGRRIRLKSLHVVTICIVAVGLWLALMAARFGGASALALMAGGRSSDVSGVLAGLPVFIYALPASAAMVVAFWRASEERNTPFDLRMKLVFWALIALCIVPPVLLGNRRFILPCLIAALLASVTRKWNTPVKLRALLLGFLGFSALAVIPFIRSAGSRSEGDSLAAAMIGFIREEGFGGIVTNFFTSYDTEMLDYIAFMVPRLGMSSAWGYGRGLVLDIITAPIPSGLLPVPSWSNQVLIDSFGRSCATGICPVPSVVGTGYFDFGIFGVVLVTFALGWLCRLFELKIRTSSGVSLLAVLVFGSLPATAVRGNFPSHLWIGLNIFIVSAMMVIAAQIVSRRAPKKLVPTREPQEAILAPKRGGRV